MYSMSLSLLRFQVSTEAIGRVCICPSLFWSLSVQLDFSELSQNPRLVWRVHNNMYQEHELLITTWNTEKFYELFKFDFWVQRKHFWLTFYIKLCQKSPSPTSALPMLVICLFFTVWSLISPRLGFSCALSPLLGTGSSPLTRCLLCCALVAGDADPHIPNTPLRQVDCGCIPRQSESPHPLRAGESQSQMLEDSFSGVPISLIHSTHRRWGT